LFVQYIERVPLWIATPLLLDVCLHYLNICNNVMVFENASAAKSITSWRWSSPESLKDMLTPHNVRDVTQPS